MPNEINNTIHSSFWANLFKRNLHRSDLIDILTEIPPFADLRSQTAKELFASMHQRQFISGEYIFLQDDPGIGLYIITDGEVQIEINDNNGEKLIIAEFGKGDFFGELALLDGEKRSASAKAKTDTKVSVLFKPDLDNIIKRYPKDGVNILSRFTKIIITRLRNLNQEYFQLYNENLKLKEAKNAKLDEQHSRPD